jgi:hypothetical protein
VPTHGNASLYALADLAISLYFIQYSDDKANAQSDAFVHPAPSLTALR